MSRSGHPVPVILAALAAAPLAAACGPRVPDFFDVPAQPTSWAPLVAADENPDPAVVEVTLEAKVAEVELLPGRKTQAWTYGGSVPGPLLALEQGNHLIVHFRNSLPEPTTIHWHGVRAPAEMDGALMQSPIPAGGSFDYAFDVPDASLFWYHPHADSEHQLERGLFGPLLAQPAPSGGLGGQQLVVLNDLRLAEDGSLAPFSDSGAMMGRQGNLLLVNGRAHPQLTVKPGATLRWRIVNASSARYFRLMLPGHAFTIVGTDGGALPEAQTADDLLLTPGERVDVLFTPTGAAGSTLELVSMPVDRGDGMTMGMEQPLIQLAFREDGEAQGVAVPPPGARIPELGAFVRTRPIVLEESMMDSGTMGGGMGDMSGMSATFSINGETWPDVTPLQAKLGEPEQWLVENRTPMDHPLHLHGFFFQVLAKDGVPVTTRAWKDTVNVPAHGTLALGTPLDGHAGRWLIHCHILAHAERGMMAELDVAP